MPASQCGSAPRRSVTRTVSDGPRHRKSAGASRLRRALCGGHQFRGRAGRGGAETERIFNALGLKEGVTVGEIGAASGQLSLEAAKIVGPTGKVYTNELGHDRVRSLEGAVKESGLADVTVLTGDPNKTNFPDACCDVILMRNVCAPAFVALT